jgi:PAS domain S-box-containing protein
VPDALKDAAFRAVVEEAPDAILLVDASGRIVYVNGQSEELFGYAQAELIGQRVEVLVPEDRRSMHAIHREVYQERPERRPMGIGLELSGRRKDGSTFPVEISLSPFRDDGARLTVAVVRDVTRQRRVEETLRRSEERHRLLNERAENVIFRYRLGAQPGFEYVSSAISARLGYAPEEFYVDDELIRRVTHEDDRHVIEQALSASAPRTVSLRMVTRESAERWFELSITTVRGVGGEAMALEGIARDVTERRAADEERLHLQSEVEMQLERARIAGDLHDDAIQSIYGLGLNLHASRDDEALSREVAFDQAIEGLNGVIASLRSSMHQLSGADEESFDLAPLPERLLGLVGREGSPEWTVEVEPDLELDAVTDRQLYLLAKELISNVQRHSQASRARLSLTRDDEGRLELAVGDDGVGFEQDEVRESSFGLRSVELRASTLGAELDVESTVGRGTRVRVCLPSAVGVASPGDQGETDGNLGARLAQPFDHP